MSLYTNIIQKSACLEQQNIDKNIRYDTGCLFTFYMTVKYKPMTMHVHEIESKFDYLNNIIIIFDILRDIDATMKIMENVKILCEKPHLKCSICKVFKTFWV